MICNLCKMFLQLGLRILINEPSNTEKPISSALDLALGLRMVEIGRQGRNRETG